MGKQVPQPKYVAKLAKTNSYIGNRPIGLGHHSARISPARQRLNAAVEKERQFKALYSSRSDPGNPGYWTGPMERATAEAARNAKWAASRGLTRFAEVEARRAVRAWEAGNMEFRHRHGMSEVARRRSSSGTWDENMHPRDPDGRWTNK